MSYEYKDLTLQILIEHHQSISIIINIISILHKEPSFHHHILEYSLNRITLA